MEKVNDMIDMIKELLALFITIIFLPSCANTSSQVLTSQPTEQTIPTPSSSLIKGFIWQSDSLFGYRILRPENWDVMNASDAREYGSDNFRISTDHITVRVVNLAVYYKTASIPNGLNATLSLFEQNPSLEGWTEGIEQNWKSLGIEFSLLSTLPQAKIFTVQSPGNLDLQILAFAVDENQPLGLELTASGIYANMEQLQKDGILDDYEVMVGSIKSIPTNPQIINPPLP